MKAKENLELLIQRRLLESINYREYAKGRDGIVFHLDNYRTAKLFYGEPKLAEFNAKLQAGVSKYCYEAGVQVPKPHGELIETLYPNLKLKEGLDEIPTFTIVMDRIRGGVEIPEINPKHGGKHGLKGKDLPGIGRKHYHLSSRQMRQAMRNYYEQLMKVHDLGIVVDDSAFFWNVLYAPHRKKAFLIDQVGWYLGTPKQLLDFKRKIDGRSRVF
jgi:hypothetical protein